MASLNSQFGFAMKIGFDASEFEKSSQDAMKRLDDMLLHFVQANKAVERNIDETTDYLEAFAKRTGVSMDEARKAYGDFANIATEGMKKRAGANQQMLSINDAMVVAQNKLNQKALGNESQFNADLIKIENERSMQRGKFTQNEVEHLKARTTGWASYRDTILSALAVAAGAATVQGVVNGVVGAVNSGADLRRTAQALGVPVKTVRSVRAAAYLAGAEESDGENTLASLRKSQNALLTTHEFTGMLGSLIRDKDKSVMMNYNGVNIATDGFEKVIPAVSDYLHKVRHMNTSQVTDAWESVGFSRNWALAASDPHKFNNLMRKGEVLTRNKEATSGQDEDAQEMLREWKLELDDFRTALFHTLMPNIKELKRYTEMATQWIKEHPEATRDIAKGVVMVVAIGGFFTAISALMLPIRAALAASRATYTTSEGLAAIMGGGKGGLLSRLGLGALNPYLAFGVAAGAGIAATGAITAHYDNTHLSEGQKEKDAISTKETESRFKGFVSFLQGKGLTRAQAVGWASRLKIESQFNERAEGDSGLAYGIGQWHPDRQARFRELYGKDIHEASLQEQYQFAYDEAKKYERPAYEKITQSRTAFEAGVATSRFLERPGKDDQARTWEAKRTGELSARVDRNYDLGRPIFAKPDSFVEQSKNLVTNSLIGMWQGYKKGIETLTGEYKPEPVKSADLAANQSVMKYQGLQAGDTHNIDNSSNIGQKVDTININVQNGDPNQIINHIKNASNMTTIQADRGQQ